MSENFKFLSLDDVIAIHENTIAHEGGLAGVRDYGLLESAAMMPQQQFGGAYLHPDLGSMAAAYLFHLCKNHPFLDGNKRCAALTALVFLYANGVQKLPKQELLEEVTLKVAEGGMSKDELTTWFRGQL